MTRDSLGIDNDTNQHSNRFISRPTFIAVANFHIVSVYYLWAHNDYITSQPKALTVNASDDLLVWCMCRFGNSKKGRNMGSEYQEKVNKNNQLLLRQHYPYTGEGQFFLKLFYRTQQSHFQIFKVWGSRWRTLPIVPDFGSLV